MRRSHDCRFSHQPPHTTAAPAAATIRFDPRNIDYAALIGAIRIRPLFPEIKPNIHAVPRKMPEENSSQFPPHPPFSHVTAQDFSLTRQHPRNLKYIPVG